MLSQLSQWIREQIRHSGAVPFVTFMQWALYHPEWGYYTSDRRKLGKQGDFYTTPHVNPVFAEVLADELVSKWQRLNIGAAPVIIECGAGVGKLARDLLHRWSEQHPAFYAALNYRIVEISPTLRELQQETLTEHADKVVWQTLEQLEAEGPHMGIVLTNELIDAFAVHRVVGVGQGDLAELYVTWDEEQERFVEVQGEVSDPRLRSYLADYGVSLFLGQQAEIGLAGLDWYRRALCVLAAGYVLTIDYGYEADMLYHSSRMQGTLRGFFRHALTDDPYERVGEQDLTADVNFTALVRLGEQLGWQTEYFGKQSKFLLQSSILERLSNTTATDPFRDPDFKRNLAIKQLILPGGIGDHFTVLIQRKSPSVSE